MSHCGRVGSLCLARFLVLALCGGETARQRRRWKNERHGTLSSGRDHGEGHQLSSTTHRLIVTFSPPLFLPRKTAASRSPALVHTDAQTHPTRSQLSSHGREETLQPERVHVDSSTPPWDHGSWRPIGAAHASTQRRWCLSSVLPCACTAQLVDWDISPTLWLTPSHDRHSCSLCTPPPRRFNQIHQIPVVLQLPAAVPCGFRLDSCLSSSTCSPQSQPLETASPSASLFAVSLRRPFTTAVVIAPGSTAAYLGTDPSIGRTPRRGRSSIRASGFTLRRISTLVGHWIAPLLRAMS